MTPAVEQLVRETVELTGADVPELLDNDAPVLDEKALSATENANDFYLVGLIGGKEVGKSALVNALAGRKITEITSHGPGTEVAVAYAHVSREPALRKLLEREVPGQYRIITHDIASLARQVLLDLPDIDSHWQAHPLVTRAMLRHMLYPVWLVSIEKYADRQPQEMLRKVAAGNSPANFVFCLNKVDQIGEQDSGEIREDYSQRLMKMLSLAKPPTVFLISAIHPERYELPRLKQLLSQQKSEASVQQSKELAVQRQDGTLLAWLDRQGLPERAARLARLQEQAEDLIAARVGVPLLDGAIPKLLDDPGSRLAMSDDILRERVSRWPLVNLVHVLFTPLLSVWRANVSASGSLRLAGSDALVETYLQHDGRPVASLVQSAFAQLRQSQPVVAELYENNRLWEDMPADLAAADLRRRLSATVDRQRETARNKLAGSGGILGAPLRWLLTIGALLWFPFVQPVLHAFLTTTDLAFGSWREFGAAWREIAGLIVGILSGAALLQSVSFLALWFLVIWLALRWNTQRRVGRLLAKWKSADYPDRSLNLTLETLEWMAELSHPISRNRERVDSVVKRAKQHQSQQAA
jgi:hypothetical protein